MFPIAHCIAESLLT